MEKKILENIVKALEEKKAEDIKILDISGLSVITDYFMITNGANQPQIDAITDAVTESFAKEGIDVKVEGNSTSGWILMDAGDLILHIFSREARDFYNLERIWKDGKPVTL